MSKIKFPSIKVSTLDNPKSAIWVDIIDNYYDDVLDVVEESLEEKDLNFSDLYIYDYNSGSENYDFEKEITSLLNELYEQDLDEDIYEEYRDAIIDFYDLNYDDQIKVIGAIEIEGVEYNLENFRIAIDNVDDIEVLNGEPSEYTYSEKIGEYIKVNY